MSYQRPFRMLTACLFTVLLASACTPPLPAATATPMATSTPPPRGSISGAIMLESEDPFLWIFAHGVNTGLVHSVNPPAGARTYAIADLPAGEYVVVGWFKPMGVSGAYTSLATTLAEGEDQMRACEEAMIHIQLEPGEKYDGADIGCFGGDFFGWAK
jgi:hypothetical protein